MAGRMVNGAAALAELVRAAEGTDELGVHRMLPVVPELSSLLPGRGLRRGSTVAVATGAAAQAGGGTSLLLALLAGASRSGSWCAVVGVPALGAVAAAESGIALDRLALVPNPGPDWPTVVAALIDGVDVVVMAVPAQVSGSVTGRLAARARQRGSVLVPFGPWSGADVTLQVTAGHWDGLGAGRGRLRRREVTVLARGRGAAARPKEITLWMPGVTNRPITIPPAPAIADPHATPAAGPPAAVTSISATSPTAVAMFPAAAPGAAPATTPSADLPATVVAFPAAASDANLPAAPATTSDPLPSVAADGPGADSPDLVAAVLAGPWATADAAPGAADSAGGGEPGSPRTQSGLDGEPEPPKRRRRGGLSAVG